MDLTIDDINILIEAMDAWESRGSTGHLMGDLVGMMIANTPEQKEQAKAERAEERIKREASSLHDKEISVLLKAKLIQMKDGLTLQEATEFTAEGA